MSADSIAAELLADVEADPDAVLAEFDADSPEELVASGGDHDAIPDDEIDVDDVTASELFADLASVTADGAADSSDEASADSIPEQTADPTTRAGTQQATRAGTHSDARAETRPDTRATTRDVPADAVVVSDPTVRVEPGGGAAIETLFAEAVPSVVRSRDGVELIGPEPHVERVDTSVFGVSGLEQSTGEFEWVSASRLESPR